LRARLSYSASPALFNNKTGIGLSGTAKRLKMKIRQGNAQKGGYPQDIHNLLWKILFWRAFRGMKRDAD
jgi:hypothetical protein